MTQGYKKNMPIEPSAPSAFDTPTSVAPDPNTGGTSNTADSAVTYPNYSTAGGYTPGQVDTTNGGYDPTNPSYGNAANSIGGDAAVTGLGASTAPSYAGGYYGEQVDAGGGGYVPGTDATAADTAAKYADPTNIGPDFSIQPGGYVPGQEISTGGGWDPNSPSNTLTSEPPPAIAAVVQFSGQRDARVRLRIPKTYLVNYATGPNAELVKAGGIVFPYAPTIQLEHKANYGAVNAVHSNYTQYFYKHSQVSEISLSAKFSVQNEKEAGIYLSVVHLLRALTKMRFGDDANAGSPPPVCRLMGYGDFMLDNVPVAIASFRQELPDGVDYFRTGNLVTNFGISAVPVLSTLQLTLIPLYSRTEMLAGTVDGWLLNNQRKLGYL